MKTEQVAYVHIYVCVYIHIYTHTRVCVKSIMKSQFREGIIRLKSSIL